MEKLFITPKWKSSYRSNSEPSPEDKRLKKSNSPGEFGELNIAVKGLQSKVSSLDIEVGTVKMKQKALDDNFTSLEQNSVFVDEQVQELKAKTYKNKDDISDTRRKLFYLGAYSRRENLKFEVIPETFASSDGDGAENTKAVLTDFLERVLGIEDTRHNRPSNSMSI